MKKKTIILIIILAVIFFIRFGILSFPYTSDVKALVYRDGKWSESTLHMDLNYNHKFFGADEFTGSIYLDDVDIMKYWKDYSRISSSNYVDTSEMKPIIITAGNVSLDDIKKIKENDIVLDSLDRDAIDDISIENNIKMPIFKIELTRWNEGKEYALEEEYKDFDWKAPSSFVSDEAFNKTFDELDDEDYIKEKIAELENFKSGFINEVKVNKKSAHKEDDMILTEVTYDIEDGKLYSALLMKRGDSDSGYVVQSVYTIKIDGDGKQEFISDKLGIFSN